MLMEVYNKKEFDVSKSTGISLGSGTTAVANSKEQKHVFTICWWHPKLYVEGCSTSRIHFFEIQCCWKQANS